MFLFFYSCVFLNLFCFVVASFFCCHNPIFCFYRTVFCPLSVWVVFLIIIFKIGGRSIHKTFIRRIRPFSIIFTCNFRRSLRFLFLYELNLSCFDLQLFRLRRFQVFVRNFKAPIFIGFRVCRIFKHTHLSQSIHFRLFLLPNDLCQLPFLMSFRLQFFLSAKLFAEHRSLSILIQFYNSNKSD